MKNFSRRSLLKGALGTAGAVAGARMMGPLQPAYAATEPSHFVHIFFNGGLNALFAGCANLLAPAFGIVGTDVMEVSKGSGIYTDVKTFGQLPASALQHWGAVGIKHNNALHTTPQNLKSGGEHAILTDGSSCFLNELAYYMGGDSAFKAVYFGDRPPAYQNQPDFKGVPLQKVSDIKNALSASGASAPSPNDPDRPPSAVALQTSSDLSKRLIGTNPGRLSSLDDAYTSVVSSLNLPPPKPVTFDEVNSAYKLGGKSGITSYASMLAGAEVMIRAANSNVVHLCDFGLASWDFHQLNSAKKSLNGSFTRDKLLGEGGFGDSRLDPIKTFVSRMLAMTDRNVVIAISGELVRLPSGDHGDGTVAIVLGKYIKPTLSFGVNNQARFAPNAPGPKQFWAAAAAAVKVPGTPFGDNPHPIMM